MLGVKDLDPEGTRILVRFLRMSLQMFLSVPRFHYTYFAGTLAPARPQYSDQGRGSYFSYCGLKNSCPQVHLAWQCRPLLHLPIGLYVQVPKTPGSLDSVLSLWVTFIFIFQGWLYPWVKCGFFTCCSKLIPELSLSRCHMALLVRSLSICMSGSCHNCLTSVSPYCKGSDH